MYVEIVPNRNSKPATLLRRGWREGRKVRKETLANLSHWPAEQVEALRRVLRGENLVSPAEHFTIRASRPHGHVQAVLGTLRRLGVDRLLAARRSRPRDLVVAMIVQRLLDPASKLANVRQWQTTSLASELDLHDADVEELYGALDWLLARKEKIEKKLAQRHLDEGSLVLYDVSSSYYEGRACPLIQFGHNRDGKKDRPIIVYGVLSDRNGRPVAVEVYPGNTGDPTTVPDQVEKLRQRFALNRVVLVGDRGMLTSTQIDHLRQHPGLGWISALRGPAIRKLVETTVLQPSLFDDFGLAEISSPDYPQERLVACFNPMLADERRRKRQDLLAATETQLQQVARDVARRTRKPYSAEEIGAKVGRVLNRFKMAKHFEWRCKEGRLVWQQRREAIEREEALDGLYVLRTSEPATELSAEDTVRSYKNLSRVEQAFRCLKTIDLRVRPIFHRTAEHVQAHIFLCVLAYYVEWYMRQAWAPLLFEDEELEHHRPRRHPVAPAKPSASARAKKALKTTPDGFAVHSFHTLLADLATCCRNTCCVTAAGPEAPSFELLTDTTPLQRKALDLLGL
jgi:hypothetical protein